MSMIWAGAVEIALAWAVILGVKIASNLYCFLLSREKRYRHTTEMRISTENARITIAMPLDMMMELLRICIQRYPYLIL